jgi:hypothetical protein
VPWLLLLLLIAGGAALGAAYTAGYFDTSDPGQIPVVAPTATLTPDDTPTTNGAPTIAPVEDAPTEAAETPTEIVETPTAPFETPTGGTAPGMIESAVPDSTPDNGVETVGP